ncbi:MAG TPA: polysaccharide deacetylase family protein [Burkholderiaceae bacterium]|nr:polysaccharide deacetylase family protein [Burkholderiaceae bacterium]
MIKQVVKAALASGPGWRFASRFRRPGRITVLMYHRITNGAGPFEGTDREAFRNQMRWIRANCRPIAPDELSHPPARTDGSRPEVLVTFDDGYRDYHDYAYPILDELRIPSVIFLATSFIDRPGLIWTDAVGWAVAQSGKTQVELPWDGSRVSLGDGPARRHCASVCKQYLKRVSDTERVRWQDQLFERLEAVPNADVIERQMLNWDEVRATRALTSIGGHTHTHPILSQVSRERAQEEIRLCTERITAETGVAPRFFAYPNGRAQDFNGQTRELLLAHGYELGFSTIEGLHVRGSDPLAIRRQPTQSRTLGDFAMLVAGR